jgi:hypothetical protein
MPFFVFFQRRKWRFINNVSFLFPLLSPLLGLPHTCCSNVTGTPYIGLDGVLIVSVQATALGKFSHVACIFMLKALYNALMFFSQYSDCFARSLDEFRRVVALERLISFVQQTIDAINTMINGTNK